MDYPSLSESSVSSLGVSYHGGGSTGSVLNPQGHIQMTKTDLIHHYCLILASQCEWARRNPLEALNKARTWADMLWTECPDETMTLDLDELEKLAQTAMRVEESSRVNGPRKRPKH